MLRKYQWDEIISPRAIAFGWSEELYAEGKELLIEEELSIDKDFTGGIVVVGGEKYRLAFWKQAFQSLAKKSSYGRKIIKEAIDLATEKKYILVISDNDNESLKLRQKGSGTMFRIPFNMIKANEPTGIDNGTGDKSILSPPEISLAHELTHFIQHCKGEKFGEFIIQKNPVKDYNNDPNDPSYYNNTVSASEIPTVKNENIVRIQLGLELRTHYGGEYIFNVKLSTNWKTFYSKKYKQNGNGYYLINTGTNEKQKLLNQLNNYKASNKIFNHKEYVAWYRANFKAVKEKAKSWGFTHTEVRVKGDNNNLKSICIFKK